jgi:hypothetical protein
MQRSKKLLALAALIGVMGALAPCQGSAAPPPGGINGYAVGDYAFDFPALDQNGNAVTLSQYAGTYVVLDYCAVWCDFCRQLSPVLNQMTTTLNGTGLPETSLDVLMQGEIVGTPSTVQWAQRWARFFNSTMPVLNLGGDANSIALTQFLNYSATAGQEGGAFPTVVILSPTQRILSAFAGLPVSLDQMPTYVNQIIQSDLTSDPSSGLAEATVLTERRIAATLPYPLNPGAGSALLGSIKRIQQNVALQRTDAACAQASALIHAADLTKDPTYIAQLGVLVGDVRTALQCPAE